MLSLCFSFSVYSQNDSIRRGSFKLAKAKDTTIIETKIRFVAFYNNPLNSNKYQDFVLHNLQLQNQERTKGRVIITDPQPIQNDSNRFDYAKYFRNHPITNSIKMRNGESDTVNILILVDKRGNVSFVDLNPVKQEGKQKIIFDKNKKAYKVDVSHEKTLLVFDELANKKWQFCKIATLKKHPSKKKIKYNYSKAYAQGILSVIYYNANSK